MGKNFPVSLNEILRQRPPFLFVDDFEVRPDVEGITTSYYFDSNEPYFAGHFPDDPIVPGVLLIEGMAQAARVALYHLFQKATPGYLVRVDRVRFNRLVRPGQHVTFQAVLVDMQDPQTSSTNNMVSARCAVFSEGGRVGRADIVLSLN